MGERVWWWVCGCGGVFVCTCFLGVCGVVRGGVCFWGIGISDGLCLLPCQCVMHLSVISCFWVSLINLWGLFLGGGLRVRVVLRIFFVHVVDLLCTGRGFPVWGFNFVSLFDWGFCFMSAVVKMCEPYTYANLSFAPVGTRHMGDVSAWGSAVMGLEFVSWDCGGGAHVSYDVLATDSLKVPGGGGSLFLLWCGWVFCVRMVVHSLFGLVTMLRFFSVLHIGIPLLAFRAGGGFLCPGFGIGVVVLRLQSV